MRSLQAFTYEIDDIKKAAAELESQIDKTKLLKNSCAIVFCGYEVNVGELASVLEKVFDFPFVGCTGVGILSSNGYSQMSISMLVMTADDCDFSVCLTDEMKTNEDLDKIREAYSRASESLPEKEKLILMYSPWFGNILGDDLVSELDRCSEGVPVFGAIASDGWTFKENYVFCGAKASKCRAAMVLISGNIRPTFNIAHSALKTENINKLITKAEGNTIYTLDDEPITDYLEKNGFITDKSDVMFDYLATPFITTITTKDGDEIDILRSLVGINHKKRSCRYIGKVEQGSRMNMVLISKQDIEKSARKAFKDVINKINMSDDYEYSTILCSSCIGRYCLIVSDKNIEGRTYVYDFPDNVNLNGFYGYSEFCPAKGKKDGKLYNALNNESLAIVAF